MEHTPRRSWLCVLRRYIPASLMFNFAWEVLQLPLYTLWHSGTLREIAFDVAHCTTGDGMIAGCSLLAALLMAGRADWPAAGGRRVWLMTLALGVTYTIYSEWTNVHVRGAWAYSHLMPVLPLSGTGLAPLLQWLVVPTTALWLAAGRAPWHDRHA